MMQTWLVRLAYIITLMLALCAMLPITAFADEEGFREVRLAENAFSRDALVPAWYEVEATPPPLPAGAATAILLSATQLRVDEQQAMVHRHVEHAGDAQAVSRIGSFMLNFNPAYQHLTLHKLVIRRGEEEIDHLQAAQVRFLQREAQLESGVYNGLITASFVLEDVRAGDTLDVIYRVDGSNPIFGGKFDQSFLWDQFVPLHHRRLSVLASESRKLTWQWMGEQRLQHAVAARVTTENGWRKMVFEQRDLTPVTLEPHLAPHARPLRHLQFSEYASWSEVADWASELFETRSPLPDELAALVAQLRTLPDEQSRASQALQWVQSNIRYYSTALGESSHRPQQPELVLRQRYGDCKDKSLMLLAILRELGLDAHPALASLQSRRGMSGSLPSPSAFDHVVVHVRIDEASFFIDPTRVGQSGRLDRLGQYLEDAEVLIVRPHEQGPTVVRSPRRSEVFLTRLNEQFELDAFDQPARLHVEWEYNGLQAEGLRQFSSQFTPQLQREFALDGYERRYPGIELTAGPHFNDDPDNNRYTITASYTVPNAVQKNPGGHAFPYAASLIRGSVTVPERLSRRFPVLQRVVPAVFDNQVSIRWPEDVSLLADPSIRSIEAPAFTARVEISERGRQATRRIVFDADRTEVAVDDLPRLIEDVRKLGMAFGSNFFVAQNELKQFSEEAQTPESISARMLRQQQGYVERTTASIAAGRLRGADLIDALCIRAEANVYLGNDEAAQADVARAIKEAPQSARAWECRAEVNYLQGQLVQSATDFSRALVLGSSPAWMYYRRGIARYYLGLHDLAAEDFRSAIEHTDDQADILYKQLWLLWTLRQAGQSVPDDLANAARSGRDGMWPAPALAMLGDQLTPDEVLSSLASRTGDDLEMALVEAWFYIGQWHKIHGDRTAAHEAFRRTAEKNIILYIEHQAARMELR